MSNFSFNELFERENQVADIVDLSGNEDLVMEQILCNINTTPIGQVLKKICSLPEVRQEKVLDVRRKLTAGSYNLGGRLDVALDKVLEDLTA
ncbi:MAG: flagellar biosynthesis anti-sigma factor FlgM [Planctomycetes bacterium]|nr:flagellar biosynthesis anti-sigma factor FlgM [Planctomycetota bacterium]